MCFTYLSLQASLHLWILCRSCWDYSPGCAGDVRKSGTRADEAERGITIKSTGMSLFKMSDESVKGYNGEGDGNEYLINIDSSEVTAHFV